MTIKKINYRYHKHKLIKKKKKKTEHGKKRTIDITLQDKSLYSKINNYKFCKFDIKSIKQGNKFQINAGSNCLRTKNCSAAT